MSLFDFAAAFIETPIESDVIEQLQLSYRLGDIDRREYVTRRNIEMELESLTRQLHRDRFDGEEYYRDFCSRLRRHIEESTRRTCGVCLCPSPSRRAVFRGCGHVACLACAEELLFKKGFSARALAHRRCACPFCRLESPVVPLLEESNEEEALAIDEDEEDSEKVYWIRAYINRKISQREYIGRYMYHMHIADVTHTKSGGSQGQIHAAECKRLEIELGRSNVCEDLAMSAAEVLWIKEKKESIERLREENRESDHTHHRKCASCAARSPRINCAFTACGHVVCGHCALGTVHAAEAKAAEREISGMGNYEEWKITTVCPLCERPSAIVRLYETTSTLEKQE